MERIFNSLKECKKHLKQFFAQKDEMFEEDGIMKLPEEWQKVVERSQFRNVQSKASKAALLSSIEGFHLFHGSS